MKKVLALDLATRTGWAVGQIEGEPVYGTHLLPETGSDIGSFLLAFDQWLHDMLTVHAPTLVVFEAPILAGRTQLATVRKLACLAGHTEFVCAGRQTRRMEADLQTVKKFFAGHGRADKAAMIAMARRYGWFPKDDNAADALGLWSYAVFCVDRGTGSRRFYLGALGAQARV